MKKDLHPQTIALLTGMDTERGQRVLNRVLKRATAVNRVLRRVLGLCKSELNKILDEFLLSNLLRGKYDATIGEAVRHFLNWVKVRNSILEQKKYYERKKEQRDAKRERVSGYNAISSAERKAKQNDDFYRHYAERCLQEYNSVPEGDNGLQNGGWADATVITEADGVCGEVCDGGVQQDNEADNTKRREGGFWRKATELMDKAAALGYGAIYGHSDERGRYATAGCYGYGDTDGSTAYSTRGGADILAAF